VLFTVIQPSFARLGTATPENVRSCRDRARTFLLYLLRSGLRLAARPVLEPLCGTTGLWLLPPGRRAFATVAVSGRDDEVFTVHAARRISAEGLSETDAGYTGSRC